LILITISFFFLLNNKNILEIADVIAKLWININPYLSTKHIKNPVEKTRKIIEKIIDEVIYIFLFYFY